jgi:hypothetical protein
MARCIGWPRAELATGPADLTRTSAVAVSNAAIGPDCPISWGPGRGRRAVVTPGDSPLQSAGLRQSLASERLRRPRIGSVRLGRA